MFRTAIVPALALLAACAPDPEAPVKVRALVLSGNGGYVPKEVQLTTVTDIVRMEGAVARLVGGARIEVDPEDPQIQNAQTEKALANAMLKSKGRDVTASYITQDDVLWPADFHTWNIVTTYYNFERAFDYFRTVGNLPVSDLGEPATVYYFPEFTLAEVSNKPLKDNALFFSPVQAFMVLPFEELQRAPLAINAGIITHEYAHRVFNLKVYGGRGIPEPLAQWTNGGSSPGANLLKALDEGLADYHAFGTTCRSDTGCNTRFMSTSFGDEDTNERDLAKADRCMDVFLRDQLINTNVDQFSGNGLEYRLGTILASALYQAGAPLGQHETLQRAIVSAYSDSTTGNPGLAQLVQQSLNDQSRFNLTSVASVLIRHVTDTSLKTAVCNELIDHLQIPAAELVGPDRPCPAAAQGGSTCPDINPEG